MNSGVLYSFLGERGKHMEYLSTAQASQKWGISSRRIQKLCSEERIPGATRVGTIWAIPVSAPKPADARIKSGKYIIDKKEEDI